VIYFLTGLVRRSGWKLLLGLWLVGCGLLVAGYAWLPPLHWQSLLSSLIGIALTGLLVWSIRVVASFAYGMEALGFGDVTLMAMVGAFLGWQAAWMGFFAGVMVALGFVLAIWLVTRDPRTPFGPYLCLGSLLVLIRWDAWFNEWMVDLFALGPWLLVVLAVSLLLLGGMLWVWGWIKYRWLIRT
jgi:prepilin signal peptidase PulO-like enzyme (type II secretory pathway)